MKKTLMFVAAALVAVVIVADAQPQRAIEFGRAADNREDGSRRATAFTGRCDDFDMHETYRGVTLSFPDASMVLHADEMTWRTESKEMVFRGTVRLTLDSKRSAVR